MTNSVLILRDIFNYSEASASESVMNLKELLLHHNKFEASIMKHDAILRGEPTADDDFLEILCYC